ncbi:MAG: hypothetical protein J0I44_02240 [Microbacterium sp.]|uniref:hypothetical protein n=1 Tax=Microbacterium sp. TaxID=51671 RepID=UPI00092AE5A3|nr:hypothetical protein [Microbacterium sp.]OJU59779.1 MAG: hypothetical protein BGO04_14170 [Microbacterium sp. 70-38]MBN9170150.1 hypothetical protein [Microbacterium sp.]MBN9185319.1 hypothetical protein [Microbacterium sp.]MBN9190583.1 hypothetical protein [Microbacterium sp.]MBN9194202.1 hypothetical protein [Microbacterium sp.]
MSTSRSTRSSVLLLVAAIVCFTAALTFGLVLPVLTTSLFQIVYGVAFVVAGLVILAYRARLE